MIIARNDYWTHPAISQSDLKLFADSPFHFWAAKIAKITPQRDTRLLRKGRALHAAVLEPDDFDARFPRFDKDLKSNAAKAEYAELEAQANALDGCVIRDMDQVLGMAKALRANRGVAKLLSLITSAEKPITWSCVDTGVDCRARIDGIGDHVIIDLKTTSRIPTRANLEKSLAEFGIAFQASHYEAAAFSLDGRERESWAIFVESELPHAVAAYPIGRMSIDVENKRRVSLLEDLADRREKNRWDFQEDVLPLELPEWALRKIA